LLTSYASLGVGTTMSGPDCRDESGDNCVVHKVVLSKRAATDAGSSR
jgi:hypothetical protein